MQEKFVEIFFSQMKASLSVRERTVYDAIIANLLITKRRSDKPILLAMVGLVGSGKSTTARDLAPYLGATIISGDDIRIVLRKRGIRYDNVEKIAILLARHVLSNGGNVIMDSDYSAATKRQFLKNLTNHVTVYFIRTICDIDIMIGRSFAAGYNGSIGEFFAGASTEWQEENGVPSGSVVKVREMMRRLPHHYKWVNEGGGKWVIKKLPFRITANIDTSDAEILTHQLKSFSEILG